MTEAYTFGYLADGCEVTAYRLTNRFGEYAVILNYGAAIQSLYIADQNNHLSNVVLGPAEGTDPSAYRRLGVVMGRCANRIAYGRFEIDGHTYQLKLREGMEHHVHGVTGNLSKQLFEGELGENSVTLRLHDDGRDGWECAADFAITYTFDDEHALTIDYEATARGNTVLAPTNHAYFNLEMPKDIQGTRIQLYTDLYAPKSELGMPDGRILSVKGTPLDFTQPRTIAEGFQSDQKGEERFFKGALPGYDDFYVVRTTPGTSVPHWRGLPKVAQATAPSGGRKMSVYTDAESVIFFTPTDDHQIAGNEKIRLDGYTAFCIETQFVPNAVNCPEYKSPVFRDGQTLHTRTIYAF